MHYSFLKTFPSHKVGRKCIGGNTFSLFYLLKISKPFTEN